MNARVFQHEAMATFFEIAIDGHPPEYARQAGAAAFREVDRLEQELSRFIESSDIARANRLGRDESIDIGHDALECLLLAADAALATNRAFDPAFRSIRPPGLAPDAPPYSLDPATHTLVSRAEKLSLDLGAIGKGYALDRAADVLREWGIGAACLNAGGSTVLALAAPAGARGWPVSLGEAADARELALADLALSASGTSVQGAHLIDPRNGQPATRATRVWASAASAALSDALSTAFFVMRDDEVAAFCAAHPEIGAASTAEDGALKTFGALGRPEN